MHTYKQEQTLEMAREIRAAGFRVFIAETGTYGFFTDSEGTRVVSFQFGLGGFKFSGNYKAVDGANAKYTGMGWIMGDYGSLSPEGLYKLFNSGAPHWATGGRAVRLQTLAQHLERYQSSSKFTEL